MKKIVKEAVKMAIRFVIHHSSRTRIGQYLEAAAVSSALERVTEVIHEGTRLTFASPNALCKWRARTFSDKEPETLEWIDAMAENAVFWDVGANVGLYAIYAAKKRNCQVWAFEPSVFNLEVIARNVFLNRLTHRVCIVPLALSDRLGSSQLRMTSIDWGGALSTFREKFGWDGAEIRQLFEFQTIGLSMDDALQKLSIPQPDYIKLDVDGIEHLILKSGSTVLHGIKGILIEINDTFQEQAYRCHQLLTSAGLVLKEKRQSEMIAASDSGFQHASNQIWVRR